MVDERVSRSARKALEFVDRHRRPISWVILGAAPALVFYWCFRFLLAHFYNGGYLLDSGIFSELIWRNLDQSSLHSPTRSSYYTIHITPFFSLLSGLSYVVPWNRVGYFAAFVAAISAFGSAIFVSVLHERGAKLLDVCLIAAMGVMFGVNGLLLGPILYPHYEHLMPLAGVAFTYCLLADKAPRLRWVLFAVALLTREDGGLHTFLLLAVLVVAKRIGIAVTPPYRKLFVPLVAAVGTSALMIVVQKYSPLNTFSAFDNSFANNPLTALFSMSSETFEGRLNHLLFERSFVWAPFAIAVFCALLFRDAGYLVGHASNVPWFILLFTADYDATSTFSLYYHFPFLIGCLWPVMWATLRGTARDTTLCIAFALSFAAVQLSAVSHLWNANITLARISATERFMEIIEPRLEKTNNGILSDNAFAALMPHVVTPEQIVNDNRDASKAKALIFSGCYPLDRATVFRFLEKHGWKAVARIKGTQYYLAAHSPSAVKKWGLPLQWQTLTSYGEVARCHRE